MIQRIKDKIRARILTIKIEDLYNTIGKEDILEQIGVDWYVGDKVVSKQEMGVLIAEAQIFRKSKLWRLLKTDIRYQANMKMFDRAKNMGDMVMGKSWLWILDCIDSRLKELKDIK